MFGFFKSISKHEVEYSIKRASLFINGSDELDKSLNIYKDFELSSHFLDKFKYNISILIKAQNLNKFANDQEVIKSKLEQIKKKIENREKNVIDILKRAISVIEKEGLQRTYIKDDIGNTALISLFHDFGKQLIKIVEIKRMIGSNVDTQTLEMQEKIKGIEAL
ncbi:MAG: hypothetical protein MUF19_00670 [Candidatus Pacebacteria bacterium]|jgi:hypothetical protein|nr:hypothetical protein [Candidatus Paceibacterota bacterium]